MDGAKTGDRCDSIIVTVCARYIGGCVCCVKYIANASMKLHILQILVVVAYIYLQALKTEVGGVPGEQ